METIKVDLYQYNELKEDAKEKARNWWYECLDFQFEWECIQEGAKEVGIELTEWDYNRNCSGDLTLDFSQILVNIIREHGEDCETHKTAKEYQAKYSALTEDQKENDEDLKAEFLYDILEDYRIIADGEYDYIHTEESIKDAMEANEYTFLKDGTRF